MKCAAFVLALMVMSWAAEAQVPIENRPPDPRPGEVVPVPDPTRLTTQAILRAVGDRKEDMAALKELLETRLEAMDKAIVLFQAKVDSQPTPGVVMERLLALEAVLEERDLRITAQFQGIEKRAEEKAKSDEANIGAALAAQKELGATNIATAALAAEKNEKNFADRLNQNEGLLNEVRSAIDGQIEVVQADVAGKIDRGEVIANLGAVEAQINALEAQIASIQSRVDTTQGQKTGSNELWALIAGIGGLTLAAFVALSRRTSSRDRSAIG